jgi:hypothetical protein
MPSDGSMREDTVLSPAIEALVLEANQAFEQQTRARHEKGDEEYGHNTFLTAPTIDMALEEIADFCNYMRYTYIQVYVFKKMLAKTIGETEQRSPSNFVPLSEIGKLLGPNGV